MRNWTARTTRVSLDLTPEEKAEVKSMVKLVGLKTVARYLRRASRFYAMLIRLQREGYLIQAIRKGSLKQFSNLDVPDAAEDD